MPYGLKAVIWGGKITSAKIIFASYAFVSSLQLQIKTTQKGFKRQASDFSNRQLSSKTFLKIYMGFGKGLKMLEMRTSVELICSGILAP